MSVSAPPPPPPPPPLLSLDTTAALLLMLLLSGGGGDGVVSDSAAAGHTVVYRSTVSVVTLPSRAGQSVTVAAHDVTVYTVVVCTVLVV